MLHLLATGGSPTDRHYDEFSTRTIPKGKPRRGKFAGLQETGWGVGCNAQIDIRGEWVIPNASESTYAEKVLIFRNFRSALSSRLLPGA